MSDIDADEIERKLMEELDNMDYDDTKSVTTVNNQSRLDFETYKDQEISRYHKELE